MGQALLRFNERTSSDNASKPEASMSSGGLLLAASVGLPGGAQSVQSRRTANDPISASRRLSLSAPEIFLIISTAKRWPRSG
jgi:hypothetical protein